MRGLWKFIWLIGVVLLPSVALKAQCVLSVEVEVKDADLKEPLPGSTIQFIELKKASFADKDGKFVFRGICPGSYTLKVSHEACEPIILHLHIKKDEKITVLLPHLQNHLKEVQVTGYSASKPAMNATTVKGKQLDAVKGSSLAEGIAGVTGVSLLQTGTNIYKPVIHGLHSNRVLILNNGIRQEGQQWGSEHAPEIDTYIADRLTVVKGAASLRYGADALGGVVLVEPKLLRVQPGVGGELNLGMFSNNRQMNVSGMIEGNSLKNPAFSWRLQGTFKRGGNARTPNYWLANSGVEEINFSAAAGWRGEKRGIEFFVSQFNTRLAIFSGSHIGNVTDMFTAINSKEPPDFIRNVAFSYQIGRPYQAVSHQLLKIKAFQELKHQQRIQAIFSAQFNRREEFDVLRFQSSSRSPGLDLSILTLSQDIIWDHFGSNKIKGSVGMQTAYQHNYYQQRFFIPNYDAFQWGAFAIEKFNLNKLKIESGIRYDIRSFFNITDNSGQRTFTNRLYQGLSGNLNAIYSLGRGWELGALVSSAWRNPQINELFSDGLHHGAARLEKGQANLTVERSNAAQMHVAYRGEGWEIEAEAYYKNIQGFIFLRPTFPAQLTIRGAFPAFEFAQTNAILRGLDLTFRKQFSPHWQITTKGALLRAWDKNTEDWIIQMPADRAELHVTYQVASNKKLKDAYVKAQVQHVWMQTRVPATGNIEIPLPNGGIQFASDYAPPPPAYTLVGLEMGGDYQLKNRSVTITLVVSNLMNTAYREYLNAFRYFSDDMGRNISLRLKWPFEFSTINKSKKQ